jgi:dipeptidase D
MVKRQHVEELKHDFQAAALATKNVLASIEPDLDLALTAAEPVEQVMSPGDLDQLLISIDKAHNGVFKMSPEIPDLVEASNNIAKVTVADGSIKVECLTRSSVEESKKELMELLRSNFENSGFQVGFSGSYPGWSPNRDSPILGVLTGIYDRLFSKKPKVGACHAGLECGIIGSHYPEMDMISFGPTIKGAHSPDERASISSVARFWGFLKEILKNIPEKDG